MKDLSIIEVEEIAFELARRHMEFDEPIPDFSSRFPGILESCLAVPFQSFFGESPYPTLAAKATILFYLMIKDHPFQNGNKRIAITTLFVLLAKNGKWLRMDMDELYDVTMLVAQSRPQDKSLIVPGLQMILSVGIVPWEDPK